MRERQSAEVASIRMPCGFAFYYVGARERSREEERHTLSSSQQVVRPDESAGRAKGGSF